MIVIIRSNPTVSSTGTGAAIAGSVSTATGTPVVVLSSLPPTLGVMDDDPNVLLSLIVPYYNQPEVLEVQIGRWRNYSDGVKAAMEVVIVDDGSKKFPVTDVVTRAVAGKLLPAMRMRVVQLQEDIGFNQNGAINTGAKVQGWGVGMEACMLLDYMRNQTRGTT